jgi:hypothetical protein
VLVLFFSGLIIFRPSIPIDKIICNLHKTGC